jgi:alkyldihydroxyacetonephosphate synthase
VSPDPSQMRWWGWGDPRRGPELSASALQLMREHVGIAARPRSPVALSAVRLAPSRLREQTADALRGIVGAEGVRADSRERILHAAGKGYADLVRMRAGKPHAAPDAVVLPASHAHVRAVLELCAESSLALIPFGGGTSVVGGVEPLRGPHQAAIALDMRRLAEITELDRESRIVTVGAGMRAAALERQLARAGLTLGHWPQSFQYVSLGGCVATRSAGQASSGYGGIAKMVLGLRLAAPNGDIELPAMPASAAGPGLRELLIGSEGALGVIDQVSLRLRAAPSERIFEGWLFETFASGLAALRALAQEHALPEVVRLSDVRETWLSLKLAGSAGLKARLGRAYVGLRGYGETAAGRCLAIFGCEGSGEELHTRRRRARAIARAHGALALGRSPGEAWRRGRFDGPYLRDELLTLGVIVETLETATRWANVEHLHSAALAAIERALVAQGTPGIVMCHVSHLYETGASLYFTYIARQREGAEVAQWQAVKQAASDAIIAGGGTITHHHAVGRDHAPWLDRELGREGLAALAALKAQLDPVGIMNPGKLLAED